MPAWGDKWNEWREAGSSLEPVKGLVCTLTGTDPEVGCGGWSL
jgi:hypothetical protein